MFENKLRELNIIIPEAPKPLAAYVPAVKNGKYVYTSGQLPFVAGVLQSTGKVGSVVTVEDAKQASRIAIINCLSALKSVIGSLDNIEQIIKVTAFINSADGFTNQPEAANGASELLLEIFGEHGKHARSAVGVSGLPRDASVEIELIAAVKE